MLARPVWPISSARDLAGPSLRPAHGDRFRHRQCVGAQVTGAIRQAARSTGTSFEYLLTTAQIESNLNPAAQATTSSAKGLYQFIEQTWLATLKQAGPALGYGQLCRRHSPDADGRYEVADPTSARRSCSCAAIRPRARRGWRAPSPRPMPRSLAAAIGRQPTEGELYIAHFLGPDGAAKLINAAATPAARERRRDVSASGGGEPEHLLRTDPASRAAPARSMPR